MALGVPLSDLLYPALRLAGVTLAPGRKSSTDQEADAIGAINRMIGGWNIKPLMVFNKQITLWPTVANQQSYTLGQDSGAGSPANWDGPRPTMIEFANLLLPGDQPIRREIKIWTDEQWQRVPYQKVYTYPEGLYSNGDFPFTRIYFYPIPDAVYQVELYTWQQIPRFTSKDDRVVLPPGYEDAIVNNGAVRLASMPFPNKEKMDPQVRVDAQLSLAAIESYNASSPRLVSDAELTGGHGRYNYLSGLVE